MPSPTDRPPGAPRAAEEARAVERLLRQADAIRALAEQSDDALRILADSVSAWSVSQQLEHMGLVGQAVVAAIQKLADRPQAAPGGRPTVPGWVHLTTGWIPRGRVRAARAISPQMDDPTAARESIELYGRRLAELPPRVDEIAAARGTHPHPALGHLTASRWLRFLHNHQRHHLEIIEDIRRAAGPGTGGGGAA